MFVGEGRSAEAHLSLLLHLPDHPCLYQSGKTCDQMPGETVGRQPTIQSAKQSKIRFLQDKEELPLHYITKITVTYANIKVIPDGDNMLHQKGRKFEDRLHNTNASKPI